MQYGTDHHLPVMPVYLCRQEPRDLRVSQFDASFHQFMQPVECAAQHDTYRRFNLARLLNDRSTLLRARTHSLWVGLAT